MSELGDVTQIIRVGFEGCEMAVRLGVGGIDLLRRAVMFFVGMLNHEKKAGKTSMRDMLKDGGPIEVFQFDEKDFKQVKKLAKKYGIQYTELPDVNADGKREIIFPADATPRVNLLAEKLNNAKIIDLEDYLSKDEEVDKLLDYLKANHIKISLATSTSEESAMRMIKSAGVEEYFDAFVCGNMVKNGKPHPEVFLTAAEKLSLPPQSCIALEDSINGIKSAYAAKMLPIMVPDMLSPTKESMPVLYARCKDVSEVIKKINKK